MKEEYDKLKMEFIKYRIANDISRFFEDVNQNNRMRYLEVNLEILYVVIFCM